METKTKESLWTRLQRGQALTEYWPTIPAAIAVMIAGSIIAQGVGNAFQRTADALNCGAPVVTEGSTFAALGPHTIEAAGWVYDPVNDRTTVAYRVTSGGDPAISHWVLGMDDATYADVLQVSEQRVLPEGTMQPMSANWSYGTDPTTGERGIKFDTGYSAGGDGNGGNGGNGNNGGRGNNARPKFMSGYLLTSDSSGDETRLISITLDGNYTFGAIRVTAKAGQEVWTDSVTVTSGSSTDTANGSCQR